MNLSTSALSPIFACLLLCTPAPSLAHECGELSPTTVNGVSLHEAHNITELTPDEIRAAKQLLRQFEGNWEGHGVGVVCLGQGANIRERVKLFEIEGDGTAKRERGEIKLDLKHDRGSRTERLRLVLNGSRLGTSSSTKNLVEVLSIGENHIEWVYRYKGQNGTTPLEARWYLNFSRTPGLQGQQATVEHRIYSLGGLASQGSWSLNRR